MLKRFAVFGAVAFGSGVFLAAAGLTRLGIPAGAWPYVWPGLVALVLLILAVVSMVLGARRLSIPLWLAFMAQTVGCLVFLAQMMESPWETVLWTVGTVAVCMAVWGAVWLIVFLRARMLERGMVDGFGDVEGVDPDTIATIRKNMSEALSLLRRAGHGRNAVYELPWFLVIGRPAAGKTEAIKRSGLGLPVRKDWVKGVGGTHTSDFFFTNDMIFVDTPGAWVQDGATESLKRYWKTLTKLLHKFRGRRPLDGLIVVVPADDLMTMGRNALTDQAANIREIVDLLHEELSFRFPVYVLVSKADLIQGFTEFFWGVPAQRRDEILGWSNPDPNDVNVGGLIERGLSRLQGHLENYRIEMLSKLGRRTRNLKLFFFSEEMRQVRQPLTAFTDELLHEDPSTQTPIFRGFYFTSAMQGEGAPVSRAMAELARQLGLPAGKDAAAKGGEESRAFFLKELLRVLMVGDGGLVARTRFHWLKQRRKTGFGTFLPAGIAALFVLLSFVSLMWNRAIYSRIETRVPRIVEHIGELTDKPLGESLEDRLAATEELRMFHRKLTSFNPLRGFGMRRSDSLAKDVYAIYKRELSSAVIGPTLERAQRLISGEAPFCADRVEIMHSVIWLRTNSRFEEAEDLQPLVDATWFDVTSSSEREKLSSMFRTQFGYLRDHAPGGWGDDLLLGFNLEKAAEDLRDGCASLGQENSLTLFAEFQKECLAETYQWEQLRYCYDKLDSIRTWSAQQGTRYSTQFSDLKDELYQLKEKGAEEAYEVLKNTGVSSDAATKCAERFDETVLPRLQDSLPTDAVVSECRSEVRARKTTAIAASNEWFDDAEVATARDGLKKEIEALNSDSDCVQALRGELGLAQGLNYDAIHAFGYQYLREACLHGPEEGAAQEPQVAQRRPRIVSPPQPKPSTSTVFAHTCNPGRDLTAEGWSLRVLDWKRQWQDAEAGAARGLTEVQQEQLKRQVQSNVVRFGNAFRDGWQKCLRGLAWQDDERTNDVAKWLKTLAQSQEVRTALARPKLEADGIVAAATEEPFTSVKPPIDAARQEFAPLADAVGRYQELLRAVGEDLERCTNDANLIAFQQGYKSGSAANSLVQLESWLKQNAGVAAGSVRDLLSAPYELARGHVNEKNVAEAYWARIRGEWDTGIAGSFPFVPDPQADLVEPDVLQKMFGDKEGLVNQLPHGIRLGPQASSWLSRAQEVSKALYDDGQPSKMKIVIYAPDAAERVGDIPDKLKLVSTTIRLGTKEAFEWGEDVEASSAQLDVGLFGLASDEATIDAAIAERKGMIGRTLGSDYKTPEKVEVKKVQGNWAPLRLLASLMPEGPIADDDRVPVTFEVPWKGRGDKTGGFLMKYEVKGPQLATLVDLLREGMGPPPEFNQ